jgi:hypothetical protein
LVQAGYRRPDKGATSTMARLGFNYAVHGYVH